MALAVPSLAASLACVPPAARLACVPSPLRSVAPRRPAPLWSMGGEVWERVYAHRSKGARHWLTLSPPMPPTHPCSTHPARAGRRRGGRRLRRGLRLARGRPVHGVRDLDRVLRPSLARARWRSPGRRPSGAPGPRRQGRGPCWAGPGGGPRWGRRLSGPSWPGCMWGGEKGRRRWSQLEQRGGVVKACCRGRPACFTFLRAVCRRRAWAARASEMD